jgi:transcriptional regulator with XRE-family HTH domain
MEISTSPFAEIIGRRLKAARLARCWTLEELASASGVSRALISKVERAEVSPTAATLAKLAAGLSTSLASLFTDDAMPSSPLARATEQVPWRDPETGYLRRNVSPAAAQGAAEIAEVVFPPGVRIVMDNPPGWHAMSQQVWMLEGRMELTVGGDRHVLGPGDCLHMRNNVPVTFQNPGEVPARYAVIVSRQFL